jgi:molybdate transport system ATP-binding protein
MTSARIGKKIPPGFSLEVEFAIPAGITALHGPSGSGKTLILKMLAGLTPPHSGRILLDDTILYDAESHVHVPPRRRRCGYVSQHDALFPHMTLRQNLAFAAQHFPRLERHRRVAEALERFQLTAAGGQRPEEVTPQQRLQAAVARAVTGELKLLLLDDRNWDEPLLHQVRGATTAPIVLATGDLDLCCSAAQLILIENGRILQRGVPLEVLGHPESIDAARLLGYTNLFQATIGALDPGRNTSRLEFSGHSLTGPYIPGHFRGDQIWVAIRSEQLRVHPGGIEVSPNSMAVELLRAIPRAHSVRLEFTNQLTADLAHPDYARQKDNKTWQVEFPPEALRIL